VKYPYTHSIIPRHHRPVTLLIAVIVLMMTLSLQLQHSNAQTPTASSPLVPDQPSTLLPPGTTALPLGITTAEETTCRYSYNQPIAYGQMTPFESGEGTVYHQTLLTMLNPDPSNVNNVYVWCERYPDNVLQLQYRSLPKVNPSYPRVGDLWGSTEYMSGPMEEAAKIDLWLGADFDPEYMRQLRIANPEVLILTSVSAVGTPVEVPEDYYLHDINGKRVEVWPGAFRLNLTKPEVAEFQAFYAYQLMLQSNMMFDGVFFDNVFMTQSWQTTDIFGTPFLYDYNEDGVHDDPADLDRAWRAGMLHELQTFRQLMPYAIMSGHAQEIDDPDIAPMFNSTGIGFDVPDAIEGNIPFAQLWKRYDDWQTMARQPQVTLVESAIPSQIAYGYGYRPAQTAPPATIDFARDYYPYMRFGLATTLMQDGYFTHEIGDTDHGNGWWYDELDFDLGFPLGPSQFIGSAEVNTANPVLNPDFEDGLLDPWALVVEADTGNTAQLRHEQVDVASGSRAARVDIQATVPDRRGTITLQQRDLSLVEGTTYNLTFYAKSDIARRIAIASQKGSPDWRNYGLYRLVWISDQWQEYTISFTANETVTDARIQFQLAGELGSIWFDNIRLTERQPDIMRREFSNGLVLLNGTHETQTITVGNGFKRLTSDQAPLYQYIVDNHDPNGHFTTEDPSWVDTEVTTGEWKARPPYYQAWDGTAHLGTTGTVRWNLGIPEADHYAISAWWPVAPEGQTWNESVTYDLYSDGHLIATRTVNQGLNGDQWAWIGDGILTPGAYVEMTCSDGAPCAADAIYVSSAARYNDGSNALVVTLQPMDGIVLERIR
jgi:hypothetical protein